MRRTRRHAAALAGLAMVAAFVAPLLVAAMGSLAPESHLVGGGASLVPARWTLTHYRSLFSERDFVVPIANSLVVAAATTALCVPLGAACAYAVARMRFPGRRILLGLVLALTMFPQVAIVSPLFLLLRASGLIDTRPGLVLPYLTFAMPLTVWLLVGTFRSLPPDLEEAAEVDGARRLRVLWEVVLPLAWPGLATTAILTFLYCWNEFLFALSFTVGAEHRTVPVAIALFRGEHRVAWGQILAAAVVATAPVVAIVLLLQRRITRGLTAGAVKG